MQSDLEEAVYRISVDSSFDSIQIRVDGQSEAFEKMFLK